MVILSICDEPTILNVIRIIMLFVDIIKVVVPIILIITVMIKLTSAITKHEDDLLNKATKSAVTSAIAVVLIFLVPAFVDMIAKISFPESDYSKCIVGITKEKVTQAYKNRIEELIGTAEEALTYTAYANAYSYLQYIKDENARNSYMEELQSIKSVIDQMSQYSSSTSGGGKYSKINLANFRWTYYEQKSEPIVNYYNDTMPYAIWGPSNTSELKSVSLPLIIWLHGAVGTSSSCPKDKISKHRFIQTVANWYTTDLDPIPAIIMAPQYCDPNEASWSNKRAINTIKALIDYAVKEYNVDKDRVMLMGHSDGGSGVVTVSGSNQDLFAKLVVMSGFLGFNSHPDYYKKIPLRGYMTKNPARASDPNGGGDGNTGMERAFSEIGRSSDLYKFSETVTHDEVQGKALTLDENDDKVSDLMYWLFGSDAFVRYNSGDDIEYVSDDVTPGKFVADSGEPAKCSKNGKYNKCSPTRGIFGSFQYYDSEPDSTENRWSMQMDSKWQKNNFVTLKKTCANGWQLTFEMHRLAKTTWEKVMDRLCMITTTGMDGYKYEPSDFEFSGARASTVARFVGSSKVPSEHSYGTALDINSGGKYTINGKKYSPYKRDVKEYEKFVEALGREDDPKNVNYIIWKKIFQPLGFVWGGNWGRHGSKSTYDGMHFEIDWKQTK